MAGIGFTTEHPLHLSVRRTIVLDQLLGAGDSPDPRPGGRNSVERHAARRLPPLTEPASDPDDHRPRCDDARWTGVLEFSICSRHHEQVVVTTHVAVTALRRGRSHKEGESRDPMGLVNDHRSPASAGSGRFRSAAGDLGLLHHQERDSSQSSCNKLGRKRSLQSRTHPHARID